MVVSMIPLNASSFKIPTRLFIRLMCAVNNLVGRAKLTALKDPLLKLPSVNLTAFGSL